jgi:EAL domain-containing protein (putative c-di-GMP-specific phosphodiesterase class I)
MLAAMSERLGLEKMLRRALENNELELHYQPQIDALGALAGVEALLRWRQPELGMVQPGKFISLAEETGLIVPIGEWVLNEACRQNKAWQRAGYPPIRMAVNVSTLQFGQPGFPELVAQVLAKNELEPRWLELEITESLLMKNTAETAEKLNRVRNTGVAVAVDDFGTGYSSLAYLQQLPIDTLKIDRSFVQQIAPVAPGTKENHTAVIRAILSMGHSLGMHVVAEGVETLHQADFLRQNGCSGMQGFYFSKPKPPAELIPMLEQTRTSVARIQPLPLSA